MTTSPEALREAVERLQSLNLTADAALPMSFSWVRPDVETLLSALQEAREALGPFDALMRVGGVKRGDYLITGTLGPAGSASIWSSDIRRAAEVYRALG